MTLNLDKSTWKRVVFGDVVANVNDYYNPGLDGVLTLRRGPAHQCGRAHGREIWIH